ncbi:MAG: acyl-CoA dehydrogenase [Bacillota bacterium]|nr:acyl-CoA dehydrogenase [Bacillota bacterium]
MATNFLYSTRDHRFILQEWLDVEKIFNYDRFKESYSVEDVDMILGEALKAARDMVAVSNDENDNPGCIFENGKVRVPEGIAKSYHFVQQNGWGASNWDKENEAALPHVMYEAVLEYLFGANHGLACYYMATGGAAELIHTFGSDTIKNRFLEKMWSGEWSGTMGLTEPSAGTDVGDMLSKAYSTDEPGVYKIKGNKCFITGGEQDFTENIVHLMLARIEGGAKGTSGISLFVVPKIWVNEDGSLGEPNDVQCAGIEHKMGIRGSATCVMSLGEENNCRGFLLGNLPGEDGKGQGMAQMFNMMNGARMEMGVGSTAGAAVAYHNASQYAAGRIQGRQIMDPKAGRSPIIKHEDVRRMLIDQKSHIEVMRALASKTYYFMDIAENSVDPDERKQAQWKLNIMTPVCKAYNSDMAWILTAEAMQCYGGYGYSEEYPIAQLARDVKIHTIWEGTNYVQAITTVSRNWGLGKGAGMAAWLGDIEAFMKQQEGNADFARELAILKRAYDAYLELKENIGKYAAEGQRGLMGLYATRILHATAKIYGAYLILEQAVLALKKARELGADHFDYAFYTGKVESAKYYVRNVVPDVWDLAAKISEYDTSAMDISEEALLLL